MGFWLFLFLNLLLLVRPEELFSPLTGTRLYLILSVVCLAVSLPRILAQLSPRALADRRPVLRLAVERRG